MLNGSFDKLSWAVVQTVTYSDIFDYPLTAHEIHRYLTGVNASLEEVALVLQQGPVMQTGDYFTLPGREEIGNIRMQREKRSRALLPIATRYGRILGSLPYIRMVALTGSLAVLNVSKNEDFDYMLVTVPGRVWTARAFAVTFNRLAGIFGHTICPNLILSENALEWPLHDLYSARELCQMIPITGLHVYRQLLAANHWAAEFLPNAFNTNATNMANGAKRKNAHLRNSPVREIRMKHFQHFLEFPLRGKLGDKFEGWEMNRKIARFSKQAGFGEETIFTADVCQGNFHHHRRWTRGTKDSGPERNPPLLGEARVAVI
jgi:hypothetical protein